MVPLLFVLLNYCWALCGSAKQHTPLTGPIDSFATAPSNANVALLFTANYNNQGFLNGAGRIYRTTDSGVNWAIVDDQMPEYGTPSDLGVGGWYRYRQGANPNTLYVLGYGFFWSTQDLGGTWNLRSPPSAILNVVPHPQIDGVVGAVFGGLDCCLLGQACCDRGVMISYNYGADWTIVIPNGLSTAASRNIFAWGGFPGSTAPAGTFYAVFNTGEHRKTTDYYATSKVINTDTYGMLTYNAAVVATNIQNQTVSISLDLSPDYGETFYTSRFPLPAEDFGASYIVMDVQEGSIIAAVGPISYPQNLKSVYVADFNGNDFALALDGVYYNGLFDWVEIQPFDGVYFANSQNQTDFIRQTKVTRNRGSTWTPITSPSGTCTAPDCYLHFLMPADSPYGWYFGGDAVEPGNLFGNGIEGYEIDIGNLDTSLFNVYASRDAGTSWSKILDGSYWWDQKQTGIKFFYNSSRTVIQITEDMGSTFTECDPFDDYAPGTIFIAYQYADIGPLGNPYSIWLETIDDGGVGSEIVYVDLGADFLTVPADCTMNDYILAFSTCQNGEITNTYRRKDGRKCLNKGNLDLVQTGGTCPCTADDYVCAFCFTRDSNNVCVKDTASPTCNAYWDPAPPPPESQCPPGGTYTGASAYRKIAGNPCTPGLAAYTRSRTVPCPPHSWYLANPVPEPPPGVNNAAIIGGVIGGVFGFLLLLLLIIGLVMLLSGGSSSSPPETRGPLQAPPTPAEEGNASLEGTVTTSHVSLH